MKLTLNQMESEMKDNVRTQVLKEASHLINGQRASDYGDASENFGCIAAMWAAYLGYPVSASDVCRMMAILKIARLRNGKHRDSSVDGAGYLALGAECDEGE